MEAEILLLPFRSNRLEHTARPAGTAPLSSGYGNLSGPLIFGIYLISLVNANDLWNPLPGSK